MPTERAKVLLKNGTRDFQNSPPWERSACFYVTNSESFRYFNFETDFLENENFFQETGLPQNIKKASFPCKTGISETNAKTNRMVATKWVYHRERSFARNYFIFLKVLFQFKNLMNN